MKAVLVGLPPCGKLAKAAGAGIYGTVKGADGDLIIIAGVDDGDIGL